MTATLMVAIPLALLGIVALLGFVGCFLDSSGFPETSPYDALVKGESSLVSFWTLTDGDEGTTAVDEAPAGHLFNGTYMSGLGASGPDPVQKSAKADGNVAISKPGIVPGDHTSDGQDPCHSFTGGVVSVPFQQALNLASFSVEAWVQPDWSKDDPAALRGVVVSNDTTVPAGFGLFATKDDPTPGNPTPDNFWTFSLGMTGGLTSITSITPIDLGAPVHLVATYDGTNAILFANGLPIAQMDTSTMGTYTPLAPSMPPAANIPLFIGAGNPKAGTSPPPLFPLIGRIQCVAIYNTALPQPTILQHFATGQSG